MEMLVKITVALGVVALLSTLLRTAVAGGGRVFSIRLTRRGPKATFGKAKTLGAFVDEVRPAAAADGLIAGRIDGVEQGGRIRLVFSKEFPEGCRQRLRNVWVALGWGDRPRRGGGGPGGGPRAKVR